MRKLAKPKKRGYRAGLDSFETSVLAAVVIEMQAIAELSVKQCLQKLADKMGWVNSQRKKRRTKREKTAASRRKKMVNDYIPAPAGNLGGRCTFRFRMCTFST